MKRRLFLCAAAALLALSAGCEKPLPEPPIVRVKPVEVVPYEEGYKVGFPLGEAAASPKAALPEEEKVAALASDEARQSIDRDGKWERGFAEGYLDGFRKIALGQK